MNTDNFYSDRRLRLQIEAFISTLEPQERHPEAQEIIQVICDQYQQPVEMVMIKCNKRECVEPRQVAHKLLRCLTPLSLARIGIMVGIKDHATVLHSIRTFNNLYETNMEFQWRVNEILSKLKVDRNILKVKKDN